MLTRLEAAIKRRLGRYASPALVKALARDVLETVREPTEAMVEAGLPENTCSLPDGGTITMAVEPAYCAMIDAALSEPQ